MAAVEEIMVERIGSGRECKYIFSREGREKEERGSPHSSPCSPLSSR